MSASSASSAGSASSGIFTSLINIDHLFNHVFFCQSATRLLGNLEVNDPKSPGGVRTTQMHMQEAVGPTVKNGASNVGEEIALKKWLPTTGRSPKLIAS
jgi:hypothetical protein